MTQTLNQRALFDRCVCVRIQNGFVKFCFVAPWHLAYLVLAVPPPSPHPNLSWS